MKLTPLRILFGLALLGSLALEFLYEPTPPLEVWDYPFFFALTGVLGCLALAFLAKGILPPLLDRPEDYYDPPGEPDGEAES